MTVGRRTRITEGIPGRGNKYEDRLKKRPYKIKQHREEDVLSGIPSSTTGTPRVDEVVLRRSRRKIFKLMLDRNGVPFNKDGTVSKRPQHQNGYLLALSQAVELFKILGIDSPSQIDPTPAPVFSERAWK